MRVSVGSLLVRPPGCLCSDFRALGQWNWHQASPSERLCPAQPAGGHNKAGHISVPTPGSPRAGQCSTYLPCVVSFNPHNIHEVGGGSIPIS